MSRANKTKECCATDLESLAKRIAWTGVGLGVVAGACYGIQRATGFENLILKDLNSTDIAGTGINTQQVSTPEWLNFGSAAVLFTGYALIDAGQVVARRTYACLFSSRKRSDLEKPLLLTTFFQLNTSSVDSLTHDDIATIKTAADHYTNTTSDETKTQIIEHFATIAPTNDDLHKIFGTQLKNQHTNLEKAILNETREREVAAREVAGFGSKV
jgi:hypothetical protein